MERRLLPFDDTIMKMRVLFDFLDAANRHIGNAIAWLTLAMVVTTFAVVLVRYYFQTSHLVRLQEAVTWMHAITFMLGAGWTLGRNAHVRVDVFYRGWSRRTRAWVDAVGTLVFLMPMAGFILLSSYGFVSQSWSIGERSINPGGLPALYLLKSVIPLMAILLLSQGLVELARSLAILSSDHPDDLDD